MRHRARRPLLDLRHRVPRTAARVIGAAAEVRRSRALAALVLVLGLGTGGYAALAAATDGAPDARSASAGPVGPRHGAPQDSRDDERPDLVTDPPAAVTRTPSASSGTRARLVDHHAGATASTTPTTTAAKAPRALAAARQDSAPPSTSLSAQFPAGNAATFTFSADESASFSCSLDGAAYTPCSSPIRYTGLASGWHTFAVRARDVAGNVDPSPARTRWHATGGGAGND